MRNAALRRQLLAFVLAVAAAAFLPATGSDYLLGIGLTLVMWIALAESWVLFSGYSGYVSLGHVVFYGIGAVSVAVTWGSVPLVAAAALGSVAAAVLAVAIGGPSLRVRGPYFVMLTFGIAEFVKYAVIAVEARVGSGSRMLLGAPDLEVLYWMMLGLAAAGFALAWAVSAGRIGAALRAIREDETAADTIGVNVARYKVIAFGLSAIIPAAVGAIMTARGGYFEAHPAFDPLISLTVICIAVIGGTNSPLGPLFGAILLVGLQELLWTRFPHLYMVVLGVLLIVFVLLVPGGLTGRIRRVRLKRSREPTQPPNSAGQVVRDAA
jgi:branched-chain amino acid transport system permease protein